jgi:hypothetical protein
MMALGAFAPEMMGESAELGELGEMTAGEAAEAGEAGEMTAAEKSSLADEEGSMSQYYKKGGREPELSDGYGKRVVSGEVRENNQLLESQPKVGKSSSSSVRCQQQVSTADVIIRCQQQNSAADVSNLFQQQMSAAEFSSLF